MVDSMTPRERFQAILAFERPDDRLPMIEWAAWWDKTLDRWRGEGLPQHATREDAIAHFGLDRLDNIAAVPRSADCPKPAHHGAGLIKDEAGYEAILPCLYTDKRIDEVKQKALAIRELHEQGTVIVRLWLDGYFWFPRTIFGIERHLYAFYDAPDLMHRMNADLTEFNLRVIDELFPILNPDMVGFAEDMSYNHGPMLSHEAFTEFLVPYYRTVIPRIKEFGTPVLIDSDGDITTMIPWMREAGIEGVYPLERQAGVDIASIRRRYPEFLMLGGYDKMVMSRDEEAMRGEFERILPVMQSGGYINSVDHQTPPGVSYENYRIYARLLEEYCRKAVTG